MLMKLKIEDLTRTNMGFPSEWEGKCIEGKEVKLSYRYGHLKVHYDDKIILNTGKDEFDIGGYMSDEELAVILKDNDMLEE